MEWLRRNGLWFGTLFALLYFFAVAIVALWAISTLWLAGPKESPSSTAAEGPGCEDIAGQPPKISRLDPPSVAIGENYAGITVFGCNFTGGARVRFNGVERISAAAGKNQLNVSLVASDFAGAGNIAVSVETEAPPKEADKGKSEPRQVVPSNVVNLRIKPATDVKVGWVFFGAHEINVELRLILLVLFVGALSASIFGLSSLVNYAGEEKLTANWLWLYFARPVMGAGIAFVFYLIIRGGFLAGTNADAKAVNPFGFVAVAALVGMFFDAAIIKLNDVFDTLFRAKDTRQQSLDAPAIDAPGALGKVPVKSKYTYTFKAKNGTPPYTWTATSLPAWLHMDSATGVLEGTAPDTKEPAATFTVQVKDSAEKVARKQCTLEVV